MHLYCLHSVAKKRVKLGLANNVAKRRRQLQLDHGPLELVCMWGPFGSRPECFRAEAAAHWWYRREHVVLEWFDERVLATVNEIAITEVMRAYERTRIYETRLDRADVAALKARGMTIEDAVVRVLQIK